MKIKYTGKVYNRVVGFITVTFTAYADAISDKRCKVIEVLEIDGDVLDNNAMRTWAASQIGKIKNLSTCEVMS